MIKFENVEVMGWEHAIRGMRNPMNSWEKSDSGYCATHGPSHCSECEYIKNCNGDEVDIDTKYIIGPNDRSLMKKLVRAGTDHRKFMRMITVYVDITAPLYWWKEFDTYKVGTVANSCSTMHKIAEKEFELSDFSYEHLIYNGLTIDCYDDNPKLLLSVVIDCLNNYREKYLETKDKKYWWQMIQLLPTSYNQKRTVMLNYEVLANIYNARNNHKLDEWRELCKWIEGLPYSELITYNKIEEEIKSLKEENVRLIQQKKQYELNQEVVDAVDKATHQGGDE